MAKKHATGWRNRIVGEGEESPDQLLANPANWRIHPKFQQDALAGVLDDVGWVQRIIVNQQTGHVVDGHLRVSLALSRDEQTIPVLYVDLTPEEEALVLATIDPLSALAVTDAAKLDDLLQSVSTDSEALQQMLANLAASASAPVVEAPEDFAEYDEDIDTDFCCPKCGYRWSGKQN